MRRRSPRRATAGARRAVVRRAVVARVVVGSVVVGSIVLPLAVGGLAAPAAVAASVPGGAAGGAVRCTVDDRRLTEASGLAIAPDGRLFSHDDSGHAPRIVVLTPDCTVLGAPELDVPGIDPEDLAAAPGPDGRPALWLADVGDNREVRDVVEVDRLAVPEAPYDDGPAVDRLLLRLPDGPQDVETLLVAPDGSALALVEKSLTSPVSRVWVAEDPRPGDVTDLREVARLRVPRALLPPDVAVTGGDVRLDGTAVALRTYASGWVWPLPADGTFAERLAAGFAAEPLEVPLPADGQGEAVAWTPDGSALVTLPEGRPATLVEVPVPAWADDAGTGRVVAAPSAGPAPAGEPAPAGVPPPSARLLLGLGGVLGLLALVLAAVRVRARPPLGGD